LRAALTALLLTGMQLPLASQPTPARSVDLRAEAPLPEAAARVIRASQICDGFDMAPPKTNCRLVKLRRGVERQSAVLMCRLGVLSPGSLSLPVCVLQISAERAVRAIRALPRGWAALLHSQVPNAGKGKTALGPSSALGASSAATPDALRDELVQLLTVKFKAVRRPRHTHTHTHTHTHAHTHTHTHCSTFPVRAHWHCARTYIHI